MLRVKEICKEKGFTIAEVAKRMGVLPPALSRIINGGNTTTETLERVSNVLGVPIAELFEPPKSDVINCPHCGGKIKMSKE
jgi:transcriptional regulator with XRE-family HTH domain